MLAGRTRQWNARENKQRSCCRRDAAGREPPDHLPAIVPERPWTIVPPVLVAAAQGRSVPTAVAGCTRNNRMSTGVINELPPTPVMPTSAPTQGYGLPLNGNSRTRFNSAVTLLL
jgi:hypothetical protein